VAQEKLIIDFWDVGQGDSTTIRLPDGQFLLIDTGPKGSPVIDWLADQGGCRIFAAVITHNDGDHAASLPSLIKIPSVSIRKVYMLLDRNKQSPAFQNIWRPVREEEKQQRLEVIGLAKDTTIWESGNFAIRVVYPSFSENIEANRPNETSAVVCLFVKAELKIIWPGDAPMSVVGEKCLNSGPHLLHGPHHGGPVDRKETSFKQTVEKLKPERVFISVGTSNVYGLPSSKYIKLLASRGCRVTCTQLTKLCHRHVDKPVLQSGQLLGLRAPRHGVQCRGCMRVTVTEDSINPDVWDSEHLARIKRLNHAKCLKGS
jgi:beta-lactamase superfamily II metal-dependent hydrolase